MEGDHGSGLTEDEAMLYDRQIRVWGFELQQRIKNARVLLLGVGGLGAEIAKNTVLSGVKSFCLYDEQPVSSLDSMSQFLIPLDTEGNRAELSRERLQNLNPNVQVTVVTTPYEQLPQDFFSKSKWDIVIATCCNPSRITELDKKCKAENLPFIAGDVFGMFGYFFTNLPDGLKFVKELKQLVKNGVCETKTKEVKVLPYPSFSQVLEHDYTDDKYRESFLSQSKRSFVRKQGGLIYFKAAMLFLEKYKRHPTTNDDVIELEKIFAENLGHITEFHGLGTKLNWCVGPPCSSICAMLGAVISQELIKIITLNEVPIRNMFYIVPPNFNGYIELCGVPSKAK